MTRLLCMALILLSWTALGQAPQLIPYQAIARDAAGQPIANASINARFTIHDETATGSSVWQEIQTVTTSALGLFTAQLGSSISLASVNWGASSKFMQVEMDLGNGFVDIGTQQMLSVPYALYAGSSGNGISGLSASGDTLYLSNGDFIIIPGLSASNNNGGGNNWGGVSDSTSHSCGAPNVHNPDLTYGTMTDQEGNAYKTIIIGTQEWMAENLRTSVYRNGVPVTTGLSDSQWQSSISGSWSYCNNDPNLNCPYGKLYNWYAIVDSRNLCPTGWHAPTIQEWGTLLNYIDPTANGGSNQNNIAGTLMKSPAFWPPGSTNSSGMSIIPAGGRNNIGDGTYTGFGSNCNLWSTSAVNSNEAWLINLNPYYNYAASTTLGKNGGYAVRCVKD